MERVDVYYLAFPKDRRPLKLVVTWVYLIGMAQTILAMRDLSNAYQSNFQDCLSERSNVSYFWLTVIVFGTAGEDVPNSKGCRLGLNPI